MTLHRGIDRFLGGELVPDSLIWEVGPPRDRMSSLWSSTAGAIAPACAREWVCLAGTPVPHMKDDQSEPKVALEINTAELVSPSARTTQDVHIGGIEK